MRPHRKLPTVLSGIVATLSLSLLMAGEPPQREPHASIPLSRIESNYGLHSEWVTNTITLTRVGAVLAMQTDSRRLYFNDTLLWLNEPFSKRNNEWSIAKPDYDFVLDPLLRIDASLETANVVTVVLDPGHGGTDSGAIGHWRTVEKKAVLDIAKRIRTKLRSSGLNVKLTRDHDCELSLRERTRLASKWGADIFVSIHLNSSNNGAASGIETFLLPPVNQPSTSGKKKPKDPWPGNRYDRANTILGYYLHKGLLSQTGGVDRGVKRAQFSVLKYAPCPAALVECGFLSNPEEENKIITAKHRDAAAEGIARGILTFASRSRSFHDSKISQKD